MAHIARIAQLVEHSTDTRKVLGSNPSARTEFMENSDKKVYFPHLDALRFFAFLAVFISHGSYFLGFDFASNTYKVFQKMFLVHGDLGVGFFFVLSGFLITTLLFLEYDVKGRISIWKFYLRRILRIWPVYFITLIVGFFTVPAIGALIGGWGIESVGLYAADVSRINYYLFFAGNFDMAYNAYISPIVGVLWSIAVEEQFYIVWPILLSVIFLIFQRKKNVAPVAMVIGLLGVIVLSLIYRYMHIDNVSIIKYATPSVVSDLALGALMATLIRKYNWDLLGQYVTKNLSKIVYSLLVLFVITRNLIDSTTGSLGAIYESFEPLIFSLFAAYIIFEQNYAKSSLFKLSNIPHANYLGKISYGLYAYHMIMIFVISTLGQKAVGAMGLDLFTQISFGAIVLYGLFAISSFALTIWFSNLSYVYVEKKILAFKDRIAASH